jgi:hypothetical protein
MNPKRDSKAGKNTLKNTPYPRLFLVLCFSLPVILFISAMPDQAGGKMHESKPTLPKTVGLWTKPDSPQFVNAKNIFDYMDGAGELYIGYRFDRLESYEYKAQKQKSILVELYFMKTSDDAFGLLSLDWGGEPVDLGQSLPSNAAPENSSWPRALYGEGLLRLWSDNIYARIMAYQETPESKEAVLSLGHSIVEDRKNPPRPGLLKNLPDSFQPDWMLRKDRTSYFRSHLVLNSLYYLGQENMLDLELFSEAVTSRYERKDSKGQKHIQFLLVRYPSHEQARNSIAHFHRAYLPEHPIPLQPDSSGEMLNVFPIEDGWLGYKFQDNTIAFIFECPDQETARTIIDQI